MIAHIGAFVTTTAGKLAVGVAVAAAGVGGAHAADVVDVPGLPDQVNQPSTAVLPDDEHDEEGEDTPEGEESADEGGDGGDGGPTDGAAEEPNHGQAVSDFVATTELEGCEKGQAVSDLASSQAADHRRNPARDHDPCHADESSPAGAEVDDTEEAVDGEDGAPHGPSPDRNRPDHAGPPTSSGEGDADASAPAPGPPPAAGRPDDTGATAPRSTAGPGNGQGRGR